MKHELTPKDVEALKHIREHALTKGRIPSMRELMRLMNYRSPRSTALIVNRLIDIGCLKRNTTGSLQITKEGNISQADYAQTVLVPLVGIVSCGRPILAEENIQGYFAISTNIAKPARRHFLLKAKGDSMDLKGINEGDLLLVRHQESADKGDIVVALIDDEATVKEYSPNKDIAWLKPVSSNKKHVAIVVTKDFRIQGVVIKVITANQGEVV